MFSQGKHRLPADSSFLPLLPYSDLFMHMIYLCSHPSPSLDCIPVVMGPNKRLCSQEQADPSSPGRHREKPPTSHGRLLCDTNGCVPSATGSSCRRRGLKMTFSNHVSSSKLAWSMLINLYLLSRPLEKGVLSHLLGAAARHRTTLAWSQALPSSLSTGLFQFVCSILVGSGALA